jgi:hypothetical protein
LSSNDLARLSFSAINHFPACPAQPHFGKCFA